MILIAYPDWRRADVLTWHRMLIEETGKSNPVMALFTAPGGDEPAEIQWATDFFRRKFGVRVLPVRLIKRKTPAEEARRIIHAADILYFTGGDPLLAARAAVAAGIDEDLRRRFHEGAVLGAYSAGAIAIGAFWPEWPETEAADLPEGGAQLVRGLNLNTRVICDFHDEQSRWEELHACMRLLGSHHPDRIWRGYGVPTRGAIRISGSGQIDLLGDRGPWLTSGPQGVRAVQPPAAVDSERSVRIN